ncbi:ABC transporter ATP-binding protein [Hymenobacter nivis]|uniref:ABC transporter ATP-binding protein n=1 Tax=Hymenobacter nivis TaxID=1850093 RepID=A0A2Z3GRA7_9BACT|nr:ABC transporter ATP-binding protein [Hymenobacter nivis]AWM34257.1 ABC transporter ATP-binding protein [Hymenobacter nivis]
MDLLTVSGLGLAERGRAVLAPLSFGLRAGQRLALAGESGAGKSTLLQLIAGLVQPSSGTVHVAGRRVRGPAEVLVAGHPGVAYLSQRSELPQHLRVEQVLRYAHARPAVDAPTLYALCRIDHLLANRTDQLSGGEQQRVALARLLLGAPQLLLLDEPFSNLDRTHKRQLRAVLDDVGARLGITSVLVSHDAADTLPWADEILVLRRGQLVQQAPPEQLYRQPADAYTAALFGDYYLVRGADRQALTAAAKSSATAEPAAGTALLVRPEGLRLGAPSAGAAAGTVRAVRFMGSYYELEIQLAAATVRLPAAAAALAPGDAVHVALAPGAGWEVKDDGGRDA